MEVRIKDKKTVKERIKRVVAQKIAIREKIRDQSLNELKQSISYARRIQEVILPKEAILDAYFKEHFVLYSPKDVVSGDFYWLGKVDNKKVLVVADSSGHGVPGAFMSMIGNVLLHFLIREMKVLDPSEILQQLHKYIREILRQYEDNNEVLDEIEMGICVIDKRTSTLRFAGANRPLLFIQNGHAHDVKGDKYGIGGKVLGMERTYFLHQFSFQKGDRLYMYSDGFQDQFGGSKDKKYGSRNLKNFLMQYSSLTFKSQKQNLQNELRVWKGQNEQTDDILVVGIEL